MAVDVERVRAIAGEVLDPELPVLTLADLGVLRGVEVDGGRVTVTITPTYSGCPALETMRADLIARLAGAGFPDVAVKTVLSPAWTTDWISDRGRKALAEYGIAPPSPSASRTGPIPLTLEPPRRTIACPHCGSSNTSELSHFGSTACKSLWRCADCREPFEHIKEI